VARVHVLSTGAAVVFMRVALDDSPPSDDDTFHVHLVLMAFLRAYLPQCATERKSATRCGHTVNGQG
jgi:hypothetical protein